MSTYTALGNTYVFNPDSALEMARLIDQDRFVSRAMGEPLAGLPAPSEGAKILDLACGPGSWVLDVAFAFSQCEVAGIDSSWIVVDYANARARTQHLANASFGVMDITESLDFAESTFDLINARFLVGVLKRGAWKRLLDECRRILKPGGVIRLTETENLGLTNSFAFERISSLGARAMTYAGYGFAEPGPLLITPFLPGLLRECGYQTIEMRCHVLEFGAGTESWIEQFHNINIVSLQAQPLILKYGLATQEELNELHARMQIEMHMDNFRGIWTFLSAWGTK